MPPARMRGDGRKAKNPKQTLTRLLRYMKPYRGVMILVVICILLAAFAQAASSKSLEYVIRDYIEPLIGEENPNFLPLIKFLCMMAAIYLVGIVSSFLYNFLMVKVHAGVQGPGHLHADLGHGRWRSLWSGAGAVDRRHLDGTVPGHQPGRAWRL